MGSIVYDGDVLEFKVDDRLLAHLQIVIINKFRKGDSFLFSWKESLESGVGRSTIWLSSHIALRFRFAGSRAPEINPTWLAALYETADSGRGLFAVPEPVEDDATQLADGRGDAVDRASDPTGPVRRRRARPPG